MGKTYDSIDEPLRTFLAAQRVFFVGTAPAGDAGHINVSPKGLDSFRILGPRRVAYLDFVGSGAETIAHVRENGRIVCLFCAFDGPPKIVRLHGRGREVEPQDAEFPALRSELWPGADLPPGLRSIVVVDVERISDSCGYGVPVYRYEGERTQLPAWAGRKGEDGLASYQQEKNAASIDGLPALRWTES